MSRKILWQVVSRNSFGGYLFRGNEPLYWGSIPIAADPLPPAPEDPPPLDYKLLVPVQASGWAYRSVGQADEGNYAGTCETIGQAHFWGGRADHPYIPAPFAQSGGTGVTLVATTWFERTITLTDLRPVKIVVASDNDQSVCIDGQPIDFNGNPRSLTPPYSGWVQTYTYQPTALSFLLSIRIYEIGTTDYTAALKYGDAYVYQEATS